MVTAVELGLLYAIMALGVYLTFRILDFADLTVDGSFTTGAAVVAVVAACSSGFAVRRASHVRPAQAPAASISTAATIRAAR